MTQTPPDADGTWSVYLVRGARYTRMHKPEEMRLTDSGLTKSAAQKREAAIKRLPKSAKTALWHTAAPLVGTEKPNE